MSRSYDQRGPDQQQYMDHVVAGGVKGIAIGLSLFIPGSILFARRNAFYRALPLPYKAFIGVMSVVPIGTFFAEKAGEHHIASTQWTGVGKSELDKEAQLARERWEKLSALEKARDWGNRHQYGIVGGSWVASLGLAFGIVARNKYQTLPQKIVQARMWAQGLTVAVLIASAVMAGVNAKGEKPKAPEDHSWVDILEQGGQLTKADRIRLHVAAKAPAAVAASSPSASA